MSELKPYIEGQPIEPYRRPRVYMTIEDKKELEAYREFGNLLQLQVLCDRYHELVEQNNELIRNEQEIRNKAIDEFAETIYKDFIKTDQNGYEYVFVSVDEFREIAEQMKGETE